MKREMLKRIEAIERELQSILKFDGLTKTTIRRGLNSLNEAERAFLTYAIGERFCGLKLELLFYPSFEPETETVAE